MDPDQQEALNDIQNSVYRTALKLRSVQTLCQLGLTDVSLIQHILPSHQCQREKQSSLTTQQLSQLLKELFQNARLDKPGQVDPKAPELTQNLLTAMYDRTGTGFIKARSAAAALIALSGDSLLTKYKALFQLYADPNGRRTLITRSAMRSLLTDLHQIPAIVGESCAPSCVEIAIRSCFHGVLNSAIGEEKFLSWLQSEPGLLLWLPTCYRLSATEMVMHHVRCSICKNFPITGLRYRCLKCLNFDLCQVCFFTERQSKPHKRSHPVMEYCVKQMSAKENAKIFFRTVRNNLLQERCRRKEARRRQTLEMMEGGDFPEHEQAPPSTELSTSTQPAHRYLSSPAYRLAPALSKHLAEKGSAVQQIDNDNRAPAQDKTSAQAIASVEAELLKVRESIKALHREKRYLRKQLNKWKDKVLLLHNSQEDKSCRLEAKLQALIANHECVQAELQQMRQEIKAMLQPPNYPSFGLCQNMMPQSEDPWEERKLHNGSDSALAKPIPTSSTEWKSLDPSSAAEKRQLLQTPTDPVAMNRRSSGTTLGSIFLPNGNPLMRQHEKSKEKGIPQTDQEGISQPERTGNLPQGIMTTASSPTAAEVPFNEKEVNEEKELQQLVLKLKDALSLQLQPAQQSAIKQELVSTAEHVCRSFSDLINHVTLPAWKK
ncbi:dystrotelin [Terrapene carolina triunguis]|uniref:dystrotelin n=1 Tax=Terrapene triunguis TaxID=2587831 RepID=UPI000CEF6C5B|nr:dystrotelin [Terrapene carolina triunguis]